MPARLAIAPGSWGVEPPGNPAEPPYGSVLDEIGEAGYRNVELGPVGYLPEQPDRLRDELGQRQLQLVAGYAMEPFHRADRQAEVIAVVERTCRALAGGGASCLVLIEALVPERSRTVGRESDAGRLDDPTWRGMIETLLRATEIARNSGLVVTFHPHAGTVVEFRDEVDRLMSDLDPDLVGLCVDSGHSVIGGIDPVKLVNDYGRRVNHVHLKDVDHSALEALRKAEASFEEMVAADVFAPLGQGCVDLPGFASALADLDFDGCATVEQDRLIGDPAALEDAAASLRFAVRSGFSAEQAPIARNPSGARS
ncbi:MAG: TIM barrel protein [Actinobacteria bacterium]|nr:TIM barrel protein [Actinomycetota bacterium]